MANNSKRQPHSTANLHANTMCSLYAAYSFSRDFLIRFIDRLAKVHFAGIIVYYLIMFYFIIKKIWKIKL